MVGCTHLTLVPVEETIARVLGRSRGLGHPDLPDDTHVGPGDDEQGEKVLHRDEVQPIDVTEIDAGETRVDRATERLEAAAPRRDKRHPEHDGRGDAGEHAEDPYDRHDGTGEPRLALRSQRVNDGEVSVHGDEREGDDTHVDRELFDERRRGAEEVRQVPALKQRRLELEWDAKNTQGDVGDGEVADEEVRHRLHVAVSHDHDDDQRVPDDRDDGDGPVEDRQKSDEARRNVEQFLPVRVRGVRAHRHRSVLQPAVVRLQGGTDTDRHRVTTNRCLVAQDVHIRRHTDIHSRSVSFRSHADHRDVYLQQVVPVDIADANRPVPSVSVAEL